LADSTHGFTVGYYRPPLRDFKNGVPESLRFSFVQNFQEGFVNHVAAVGVFQPDAFFAIDRSR
jgi:hypothetical protein